MSFLAPTLDVLSRTMLRLWFVGVAVAVVGVSIWGFNTQVVGAHVTECGFDSQGAYAKLRVNNLLGGDHYQQVEVSFNVAGKAYESGSTRVYWPAHGYGTGVVHERFPPHGLRIEGRTVYVLGVGSDHPRFVTKKFALKHRGVRVETVPADSHALSCWIMPGDGW